MALEKSYDNRGVSTSVVTLSVKKFLAYTETCFTLLTEFFYEGNNIFPLFFISLAPSSALLEAIAICFCMTSVELSVIEWGRQGST